MGSFNTFLTTQCFSVLFYFRHYSIPLLPEIPGLENFSGKILHSHNYRIPEPFADQKVAVLGAASSGQDISLEIAKHAKKVCKESCFVVDFCFYCYHFRKKW